MNNSRKKVLAVSGSIRRNSGNEAILKAVSLLHPDLEICFYDGIGQLPYFNPDLVRSESDIPANVKEWYRQIDEADGVLICTPEYVFSLPGVLKNALEWTVSTTLFSYKPFAFIVASASGEKAFESLDLIMATLLQEPVDGDRKLLIRGNRGRINDAGEFINDDIVGMVNNVMDHLKIQMENNDR